ncbi:hypothetical protein IAT40_006507 [Kwoniella sp. CBS 6097]
MSGIRDEVKEHMENTFTSGQPGTTGREPFERPVGDHDHHLGQHGHQHGTATGGLTGAGISGSQHGTAPGSGGVGSEVAGSHHTGSGLTGSSNTGSTTQNLENEARSFASGGHSGTHGHHSHDNQGHIGGVGSRTAGAGGVGAAAGGAEDYVRSHGGAKDAPAIDDYNRGNTGSGITGSRDAGDRTGNLNQGGALYERTTDQGPATSGAAGTDRFDSDRHHSSRDTTGTSGPGFADTAARTGVSGHTGQSETDRAVQASGANKDGGGLSGLTTTDDEFTGKSRSHKAGALGAYADTEGPFQGNTSGPGGNTALTGREGNPENNPVARAQSSGQTVGDAPHGTSTRPGVDETAHHDTATHEKKGIIEKIKEAF